MPVKREGSSHHQHHIIRSVAVVRGSLSFNLTCRPAFNYAQDEHEIHLSKEGAIFHSKILCLGLTSSVPLEEDGQGGVQAHFTLHANQRIYFILESAQDNDIVPRRCTHGEYEAAFQGTVKYWRHCCRSDHQSARDNWRSA